MTANLDMIKERYSDFRVKIAQTRKILNRPLTYAEKILYHELSRGKTILDAVQRSRYELTKIYQI